MSTNVSKILTYYQSVVFINKINLLGFRHWCFPGKFMNFSEAVSGGVFSQYSRESYRPVTLLKTDSNTGIFKRTSGVFRRSSANSCFWFFKTTTEHQLRAKFQTAMVSCPRFIWITNSSDHRRVWTANLLHTKSLPNPLGHKAIALHDTTPS